MVKKYSSLKSIMAGTLATSMLFASAPKIASAEGLNIRLNKNDYETRITAMYSIPIGFFGEGKNTKYNSRNKSLESQVAGLTQVPAFNAESSSQPYFEKYEGNCKGLKEFGHGFTSFTHLRNKKTDGTTRGFPAYSTVTREGSLLAPVYGVFASIINGTSKLFGCEYRVYNPIEKNFWRTIGTTALLIVAGATLSSGGGGDSSPQSQPAPEPEPEDPDPGGTI